MQFYSKECLLVQETQHWIPILALRVFAIHSKPSIASSQKNENDTENSQISGLTVGKQFYSDVMGDSCVNCRMSIFRDLPGDWIPLIIGGFPPEC
jgi:hypothetical protein